MFISYVLNLLCAYVLLSNVAEVYEAHACVVRAYVNHAYFALKCFVACAFIFDLFYQIDQFDLSYSFNLYYLFNPFNSVAFASVLVVFAFAKLLSCACFVKQDCCDYFSESSLPQNSQNFA